MKIHGAIFLVRAKVYTMTVAQLRALRAATRVTRGWSGRERIEVGRSGEARPDGGKARQVGAQGSRLREMAHRDEPLTVSPEDGTVQDVSASQTCSG